MSLSLPRKQRTLTQLPLLHQLQLLRLPLLQQPLLLPLLRLQPTQPWQRFGLSFQEQRRSILRRLADQIPEVVLRHLRRHQVLG